MVQVNHAFRVITVFAGGGRNAYTVTGNDTAGDADNDGVGRNLLEDNAAAADFGVVANLKGDEHLGAAGNNNVVADGRMTFALFLACTAKRYALIQSDIAAKLCCFADDKAMPWSMKRPGPSLAPG